jgi:WD40 repeat protein
VALSADGELLASGGQDSSVRLWQTRSGEPLATLQGHTAVVYGVALSACWSSGGADVAAR